MLTWETADDINNAGFEAERSTDGRNWMRLAVVQPQPSHKYEYIDNPLTEGIYFYRIRQVDFDGTYKYSMVNMIRMNRDNKILVWPNPVTENLFIQAPFTNGSIDILDPGGRIIRKEIINATVTIIPVQQLAKGVYFIRIRRQDEVFTTRFIKE